MEIVDRLLSGDIRAVARIITYLENNDPKGIEAIRLLYPKTGNASLIGITGPPGAGKSTLVDKMAKHLRARDRTVAIVAVDPTSPFTGGALLGDRVRMREIYTDPGVFIRSMGTRGHLGGLALSTGNAVKVLDAYGFDYILVETVGAGQSEVDIIEQAHTVVVVTMPGMGDEIQVFKAGIMEIGDVFVINKADRDGADKIAQEIDMMLDLDHDMPWKAPVIKTVASEVKGIDDLMVAIANHQKYMETSGELERFKRESVEKEFSQIVERSVVHSFLRQEQVKQVFEKLCSDVQDRCTDPYSAAERLLDLFLKNNMKKD